MSLSARAAAIRGDDYQHAVGWYWACRALQDPDIETVSIEDPGGGSFDDVVVRRRSGRTQYIQVKSSTHGDVLVDQKWLLSPVTTKGRSPLQHFYETFLRLQASGLFTLELWTNRGFDSTNPFLGKLLDRKSERLQTPTIEGASPRSAVGREREAWARHLEIEHSELIDFLDCLAWKHTASEPSLLEQSKPLMELSALRFDAEAIKLGVGMVRSWVTDGRGPQSADDIRRAASEHGLLAREGTLLLAIHGIDREPLPGPPNIELDFVDLYKGEESFSRKQLEDPSKWDTEVRPAIENAARSLAVYPNRHVHIAGALRHPMWFAVGRSLPQVKKWVLSADQSNGEWRTDAQPDPVRPRLLAEISISQGTDLGFAIGLTGDPTRYVEEYIRSAGLTIGRLLVLGPPGEPGPASVPSDCWAMGWSRGAREIVRDAATTQAAPTIHAFFLCPAGIALMLGHQWNVMPRTIVYEFVGGSYVPTITFPGV
jgi:hypothetical protein